MGEGDKALAAVEAPVLHHGIDLLTVLRDLPALDPGVWCGEAIRDIGGAPFCLDIGHLIEILYLAEQHHNFIAVHQVIPVIHDLLLLSMKANVLKECQQVTGQQLISLEMVSSGTVLRENPRDTSVVFSGASMNELPVYCPASPFNRSRIVGIAFCCPAPAMAAIYFSRSE